jgi:tetratricopeptide (TPR) repeat protein
LMLVNMYLKGDAARGIEYGEQSLAIARTLNLTEQIAYLTGDLGVAYCLDGQLDKGQVFLDDGKRLWLEMGNLPMFGFGLVFSMAIWMVRGRYKELLREGDEVLRVREATHTVWPHGNVFLFKTFVWLDYGEPAKAIQSLDSSIHFSELGNQTHLLIPAQALSFWYYASLGALELAGERYRTLRRPLSEVFSTFSRVMTSSLYAMYEIASGQLETAEITLREFTFAINLPWATWYYLAKSQLAFAKGDYPQAIALAATIVDHMRHFELNQFLPDVLFVQGKAQLMLGKRAEAKESFAQARAAAEALGSRRMLWQILAALAELDDDAAQANALRAQAREIVAYIVEHMPPELRGGFLHSPPVRAIMH